MTTDNQEKYHTDLRSLLTWLASGALLYLLVSGGLVFWLPFSVYTQYSVIVHTIAGVIAFVPACWIVMLHWQRRSTEVSGKFATLARLSVLLLLLSLLSGLVIVLQATFGRAVSGVFTLSHQLAALAFGIALFLHLLPILQRYRTTPSTPRRLARRWLLAGAATVFAVPLLATHLLSAGVTAEEEFQAFPADYEWRYGKDRPFWPSRARIRNAPWESTLDAEIREFLSGDEQARLLEALTAYSEEDGGRLTRLGKAAGDLGLDDARLEAFRALLAETEDAIEATGAIRPEALLGSETCGSSGCHDEIYREWLPSAHGFSAIDVLFRDVQESLAHRVGSADTRACAGCHDPVTLLSGARDGGSIAGDDLVIHEGNSCLVCHSMTETDTAGNGGYVMQLPERYLYAGEEGAGWFWNRFLIRSYSEHHVRTYARPLYARSEFCAACHKQTSSPGDETMIGLAQEQNEYDSWREGHWHHEDDPEKTIGCVDCHMPLVDGNDPGSDGKHRSHRALGSNMYIPVVQNLPGGKEQAQRTIAWLRGEIPIPEIADKWADGPVVAMSIVAPEEIRGGDLVNLTLVLHNNKTGHDFPAGPLDILASWVELRVEDNLGRTLMHLGDPAGDKPTLDAPVVYKADWYDKRGLPVERHDIWEVVGSSYKRQIGSGDAEMVDVPFRCPVIARPKISESFSEQGPGERKSDVVFQIENEAITELTVTARLLYRKADPEFIAKTYGLESAIEVPVIELNTATHTIRVRP